MSRIQLVRQAAAAAATKGATTAGLAFCFLVAKANFVVVMSVQLEEAKKKWKVVEVKTQSSLNAGTGAVVGAELNEEGTHLLVASQKGPILR